MGPLQTDMAKLLRESRQLNTAQLKQQCARRMVAESSVPEEVWAEAQARDRRLAIEGQAVAQAVVRRWWPPRSMR